MSPSSSPAAHTERISDIDVATEMQDSFLEYAYSVIYSRALPDARDGLKPVQRRILFQMADMGLRPDRGHVKSARVVGEVMGKLHPHGDASIYDALVRLAQDFSLRLPLIDGHGNFGSLDDGPAAARYTEARLAESAMAMTESLDEDVVDFEPNYDNQLTQPQVLAAAFPNLLVNGASGIAVGMATNMAPHNLVEVVAAAKLLLTKPDASLDELMAFVPGPDLPGGGVIMGLDGIREAYETGRGAFRTRARVTVENVSARKTGIVITELPYLVGPEKIIDKIKDGVNSKKITGVSNVVDLTDRHHGLKLVVEIKTGFNPEAVLEQLYRFTPLEDTFSINNVALVDGSPQTLGLRDMLRVYVDHRLDVVRRRSAFRLNKRKDRLHLVDGLLIAIADIDEVIQVIRSSDDGEAARARLIEVFDLSVPQADYILELRLRRLTKFSRIELEAEATSLRAEIAELESVLADDARLRSLVSGELDTVSQKLGTPRRTVLSTSTVETVPAKRAASAAPLQVEDSPCVVVLSADGVLVRVDRDSDADELAMSAHRSLHDSIRQSVASTRRATLGAVTTTGRLIHFSPINLPGAPASAVSLAAGVSAKDYVLLEGGENIVGITSLDSTVPLALGTSQGVVKRIDLATSVPKSGQSIIALKDGDFVVGVAPASDSSELVFITSDTQLLRFGAEAVRPQGAPAGGMAGIRVNDNAQVIFFGAVDASQSVDVITVSTSFQTLVGTDSGRIKLSSFADYPGKGRGTGGLRSHALLKGEDALLVAWVGPTPARANGLDGSPRDLPREYGKRDGSGEKLTGDITYLGAAGLN
jgi:DNA gyrase subunit A